MMLPANAEFYRSCGLFSAFFIACILDLTNKHATFLIAFIKIKEARTNAPEIERLYPAENGGKHEPEKQKGGKRNGNR